MNLIPTSPEVAQVLELAKERHWGFRVIWERSVPDAPFHKMGRWFVPLEQDSSIIPAMAGKRIAAIQERGIPIQGIIVAHDDALLLPAPTESLQEDDKKIEFDWTPISEGLSKAAPKIVVGFQVVSKFFFAILLVALQLTGIAIAGFLQIVGLVIAGVFMLDPAVIVVLEDGTWVEVMSWYEL